MAVRVFTSGTVTDMTSRRLLTTISLLSLLALSIMLAGCGSSSAPSADQLVSASLAAMHANHARSVNYELSLNAHATALAGASAQVLRYTENPLSLQVKGGVSATTFTADGQLQLAGQTITAHADLGPAGAYVNLLGTWYGDRTTTLSSLESKANQDESAKEQVATTLNYQKVLLLVRRYSAQAINATVSAGPNLDGPTWQLSGTVSAAGIAQLAKAQGHSLPAKELAQLSEYAGSVKLTYAVGRDDHLPRLLELDIALKGSQLGKLAHDLSALNATFKLSLSDYGTTVTYTPPAQYEPLAGMLNGLIGPQLGQLSATQGAQPTQPQPGELSQSGAY